MAKNYGGSNLSYAVIQQQGSQHYDLSTAKVVDGAGNPLDVTVDSRGHFCATVKEMAKKGDISGVSDLGAMVIMIGKERFLELPHNSGSVRYAVRSQVKPQWLVDKEAREAKRAAESQVE